MKCLVAFSVHLVFHSVCHKNVQPELFYVMNLFLMFSVFKHRWVFSALIQTTRTLRLRRNLVKLSLYKHFTNTLVFAVISSIIFMLWSIKYHKVVDCLTEWRDLWVDEAFWHLLFSVILTVIMILWRPSQNNQRYAFTPLLDKEEDYSSDEDDVLYNDAWDGMKMRGAKSQRPETPDGKDLDINKV